MSISLNVESYPNVVKVATTKRPLNAAIGKNPRGWAKIKGREFAHQVWRQPFLKSPSANGPIDIVDLFCGCGGLSLGFEFLGRQLPSYRLAGAVDNNVDCVETYQKNLKIRPVLTDIAAVARRKNGIEELISSFGMRRGSPRVLLGGPPCQGFSAHQKKSGHNDDERNEFVVAFSKFVKVLRPDAVVMENVPELFAKRFWHHFNKVRTTLTQEGYIVRAQILNLAGFGVPQARFRAVIIAMRKDFSMPAPFLGPRQYSTVRDAIGNLPLVKPGGLVGSDAMHYCTRHRESTIETIRLVPKNGGRRPAGVGPKCLDKVNGFRDVYGRMFWDRPSNTITGSARNPASGRYVHPQQDRGLTIREAALLQTFPPDFIFEGPFDDKFSQIGNAVPPAFATYLAAHVLGELRASNGPDYEEGGDFDVESPTSNSFSSGIAGRKKMGITER